MPVLLYAIDEQGRVIFWNRTAERVTGYSKETMIGNPEALSILCPDEKYRKRIIELIVATAADFHGQEMHLRAADGTEKSITWTNISNSFPVQGWSRWGIGIDITDKQTAEAALMRSEADLRKMIDQSPIGINVAQDGIIRYVNQALAEILGRRQDEILGHHMHEFIDPQDHHLVGDRHQRRLRGEQLPSVYNFRLVGSDGGTRWSELHTMVIEWNNAPATLNFNLDITDRVAAEESLRESEQRYQALAESTFEAVFVVAHGRCIDQNKEASWLFGYDQQTISGMPVERLFSDKSVGCVYEAMGAHTPIQCEATGINSQGDEFTVLIRSRDISYKGADARVLVISDVSDQKRIINELAQSESIMKSLLEAAPVGIGRVAGPDRLIDWTNRQMSLMTGYEQEELSGMPARLLYESDHEYLRVGSEKHSGVRQTGLGSVESRWVRKNGTAFDLLLSSAQINPDDFDDGLVFTAMDISERKKAERLLRESERRLRNMVENLPQGAVLRDGDYLFLNRAAEQITGFARHEMDTTAKWFGSLFGEEAEAYQRLIEIDRDNGFRQPRIMSLTRKDGENRLVEFSGGIIDNAELWVLIDITDAQRAKDDKEKLEEQLRHSQKMEALGTLAGGIAHDFNNILAAIIGFTELAQEAAEGGMPTPAELNNVLLAAGKARELVKQILTFSRQAETELKTLDLNHEIRQTEKLLRRMLPRMIEITLNLSDDSPKIMGNVNQLEQVMMNLASNAGDSMPDGGELSFTTSRVTISEDDESAEATLEPGDYALLIVCDTGQGMDQKTLQHIFDPFFTTKGVGRGTGLGLATVYGIVKGHFGHIDCYSEVGKGTSFKLYFPASQQQEKTREPVAKAAPELPAGSGLILLVDDEPALVDIGSKILGRAGYDVVTAESGEGALEIFKERHGEIAAVVLDVNMPGMGGHKALEEIRIIDPEAKVIIASGYAPESHLRDIMEQGVNAYVAKPFRKHELLESIDKVLGSGID